MGGGWGGGTLYIFGNSTSITSWIRKGLHHLSHTVKRARKKTGLKLFFLFIKKKQKNSYGSCNGTMKKETKKNCLVIKV